MKNPKFNFAEITEAHLEYLQRVVDGLTCWSNDAVMLLRRGLVEEDGLYSVKPTFRGLLALRGVVPGAIVQISNVHHLPQWHGRSVRVVGVHHVTTDSDGFDQYGYQERWPTPAFRVDVKPDGEPAMWCFYKLTDLEAIPSN